MSELVGHHSNSRAKVQKIIEIRKFLRVYLCILCVLRQSSANGSDDEAAKSGIILVGRCAQELGVGTCDVLVSGFAVLDVTVLPIRETFGVKHFGLAKGYCLRESADSAFAALGKRSGVRVHNCVSVRATVAGTHDDTFFAGEFATKMVKRKGGFYFSHMSNKLGSCHSETIV